MRPSAAGPWRLALAYVWTAPSGLVHLALTLPLWPLGLMRPARTYEGAWVWTTTGRPGPWGAWEALWRSWGGNCLGGPMAWVRLDQLHVEGLLAHEVLGHWWGQGRWLGPAYLPAWILGWLWMLGRRHVLRHPVRPYLDHPMEAHARAVTAEVFR